MGDDVMNAYAQQTRRAIFAACRRAGIDDDDRRDIGRQVTGKASLTKMTPAEMAAVLNALNGRASGSALPRSPGAGKLRALWISGWHLGVVRDRTDAGLTAWLKRQTGLDAARWATPADTARAIDALKAWLAREAGVEWARYDTPDGLVDHPRARVLEAQRRIVLRLEGRDDDAGAARAASDAYFALGDADADRLIQRAGGTIRRAQRARWMKAAHGGAVGAQGGGG